MCIFFFRYGSKTQGNGPRDTSGLMCMCVYSSSDMYWFFLRYGLQAQGNRPRDPSVPMCMCVHASLDMY